MFALVFGLIASLCALTGVLTPVAIVFGIVGIVLGAIGRKKGAQMQHTGKGSSPSSWSSPSLSAPVQQQINGLMGWLPRSG